MKDIKVLGIDLAKNIFQLHGTNVNGKCVLRKRLTREKMIEFVANMKPCIIGIEACMGAHYWSRIFQSLGHTVKIMSPQFVKPYVMSNKNDRNDARGIAEAVTRPNMKFVAVKTIEQQDVLLLHRARELVMKQRTAQANQIRGLLLEYGITIPQGIYNVKMLLEFLEDNKDKLTTM
ncbi:MAG TPA: IS110 family transposase, partial [Waddliaceae bacterium]